MKVLRALAIAARVAYAAVLFGLGVGLAIASGLLLGGAWAAWPFPLKKSNYRAGAEPSKGDAGLAVSPEAACGNTQQEAPSPSPAAYEKSEDAGSVWVGVGPVDVRWTH